MSDAQTLTSEYLDRYAASLTSFDAKAAAELWSQPGLIMNDSFSGVLESRAAMLEGLKQSYPLYQELGLSSVEYELQREEQLSDAITLVFVRWLFLDSDGSQLTDSNSYYILRREDDGLHACVCIETDSAEKLQTLAAERGIALPPQAS